MSGKRRSKEKPGMQGGADAGLAAATEVPASDVKKAWHHYVDRVTRAREIIVVTRYGRPVATLAPVGEGGAVGSLVGSLAGTVTIHGDIVAPTGEAWEADG